MSFVEIKRIKQRFSDIDLSLTRHPISNDITKNINVKAISNSIKNLILTKTYGRPFHPELSCDLYLLLFENLTDTTIATMNKIIINTINNFEPRVELKLVECKPINNKTQIEVTIIYSIIGTTENIKTQFVLQRII